jgi:hypothetical protein
MDDWWGLSLFGLPGDSSPAAEHSYASFRGQAVSAAVMATFGQVFSSRAQAVNSQMNMQEILSM